MSYCVNCGVELARGEKKCPLCGVKVINPAELAESQDEHAYPEHLEKSQTQLDKSYIATIAALLFLIPIVVCIFADLVDGSGLSWSAYVGGGLALLYVFAFVPLIFKKPNALVCLAIDAAATLLFLMLAEWLSHGSWFLTAALPVCAIFYILLIGTTALFMKNKSIGVIRRIGISVMIGGAYAAITEIVLFFSLGGREMDGWSIYVIVPCIILGVIMLILDKNERFKEQLKRKLFV